MQSILQRLARLETVNEIRNSINRYMEICDALDANTNLAQLMELFDEQAIWEGIGERYQAAFGRYEGRSAIENMFANYMQQQSHFVMNAHFVSSEQIDIHEQLATGHWLMLQTSTFRDGSSHLNAASLHIQFKCQDDGHWKISHFQTENIFSRPISHWESAAKLPVPKA